MATNDATDADATETPADAEAAVTVRSGGRKKLVLAAVGLLVIGGGLGAAYMTGMTGRLFGGGAHGEAAKAAAGFVELPDIMANLDAGPRRTSFVKLKVRIELASKSDEAAVRPAQAELLDLFQTYLRDMHPDELRGSVGSYRLREELMARANIALAPARVTGILFLEMLVQ